MRTHPFLNSRQEGAMIHALRGERLRGAGDGAGSTGGQDGRESAIRQHQNSSLFSR